MSNNKGNGDYRGDSIGCVQISNSVELLRETIGWLFGSIYGVCDESVIVEMKAGLFEIILNAIEHGNLKIGYDEKYKALIDGTYDRIFSERLDMKENQCKLVTLRYEVNNLFACFRVDDDGDGFDWKKLDDEFILNDLFRPNGRGIYIARMLFDEVEYCGKGNKVILLKNLK